MGVLDFPTSLTPRNAIMQAEFTYQKRSMGRRRRWQRWVSWIIMAFGVTMSMILFWGEFAGSVLQRDAAPIGDRLRVGAVSLLVLALIYHFILMLQTLSLSANSITREKQNATWDMLVLTGIDSQQIVRGKWWATVRRQWRSYILLGVLRAGVVVWVGAATSRSFLSVFNYGYATPVLPTPLEIILAGVVVFVLTMVNLPFTAACGVLASAEMKRSWTALARAIATRTLSLIGLGLIGYFGQSILYILHLQHVSDQVAMFGARVLVSLIDNGASAGFELSTINYVYVDYAPRGFTSEIVISAVLTLGIYLLLTRYMLWLAQRRTVREQALPPLKMEKVR